MSTAGIKRTHAQLEPDSVKRQKTAPSQTENNVAQGNPPPEPQLGNRTPALTPQPPANSSVGTTVDTKVDGSPRTLEHASQSPHASQPSLLARADATAKAITQHLIRNNGKLDAQDAQGRTALSLAATDQSADYVEMLILQKADVDQPDLKGKTPLMYAAESGNIAAMEVLIKHDAAVTATTEKPKISALHFAARENHVEAIALLVKHGAVIEQSSDSAETYSDADHAYYGTPLMLAVRNQSLAAVKYLVRYGANASFIPAVEDGAFHLAAVNGFEEILLELLPHIDERTMTEVNGDGRTPVTAATWHKDAQILKILLAHGVDPNLLGPDGEVLIAECARNDNAAGIRLLLEKGVPLDYTSKNGKTLLMIAASNAALDSVNFILAAMTQRDAARQEELSAMDISEDENASAPSGPAGSSNVSKAPQQENFLRRGIRRFWPS